MSHLHAAHVPFSHEQEWVQGRLRDGSVAMLRPLQHGETAPLLAVFEAMSADSRALRYLTGLPRLPASMLSLLSDVDDDRHVAWTASVAGHPAGVARYVRLPGCATTAEIAFEVADRHHGLGLGTLLLDTITTVAVARGVRRVRGTMAPSNTASRHLLKRVGATSHIADGLVEAEGPLRLMEPPSVDRSAVLGLACAGSFDRALDIG